MHACPDSCVPVYSRIETFTYTCPRRCLIKSLLQLLALLLGHMHQKLRLSGRAARVSTRRAVSRDGFGGPVARREGALARHGFYLTVGLDRDITR